VLQLMMGKASAQAKAVQPQRPAEGLPLLMLLAQICLGRRPKLGLSLLIFKLLFKLLLILLFTLLKLLFLLQFELFKPLRLM
jgi:hypothetical protein